MSSIGKKRKFESFDEMNGDTNEDATNSPTTEPPSKRRKTNKRRPPNPRYNRKPGTHNPQQFTHNQHIVDYTQHIHLIYISLLIIS